MAASISAQEAICSLRPVDGRHIGMLMADLAQLLRKRCSAVTVSVHVTQQPQHIPAWKALLNILLMCGCMDLRVFTAIRTHCMHPSGEHDP